ncbi:sensor histidine kinase [Eisenbergiella sp.]
MKKKIISFNYFLNNLSFTKKFVLLFICGIVVPMLVQNMVYYLQTEKNIQEEMLEKINEAMDDKAEKINTILSDALSLAKGYYNNETLYQYLDFEYGRDLDYLIQYQDALQVLFSDINLYPYHIRSISLYTDNNTLLNGSYIRKLNEVDLESLGQILTYSNLQAVSGEKNIYFRVSHENRRISGVTDSRSISMLCVLNHYQQYSKYKKVLRIDLVSSDLKKVLLETNLFENMFLTDSMGSVAVAARKYSNSGELDHFDIEEIKDNVILLSRPVGNFPITLYGVYDMQVISQEFNQSRTLSFGISLVCLLFALICVYAVVGNMNRRLANLVKQSEEISRGNFIQCDYGESGKDEYSVLENSLNQMSSQLKELIEREYKAELSKMELEKETNQARFLALQSQVNPHFMFNALESIRLKAIVKGELETAEMIKYMAKMFRNLIEWDNNIITLKEEIKFLDEFLHIQNYRFEDEFSYEIYISEQAKSCLVPKMILQPLVENACVHGVEALDDDRWVRIDAIIKEGNLMLQVEDNGGGMSEEKLQELKRMLNGEAKSGRSVGLWNVYRRLGLYYGNDFQFSIDSVPGNGTKCIICIPVKFQE